ncbi:hypothetical protein KIKIMORA_00720 [Brevundimonas phage vB_BpoS-Kikimora]|uniref:Uncharacterized protein n=1 Tax=Brevundimonas phage vB_BpoS-Kikimora TaxID=2948601 RepID=A0A9E7SK68_9CAUD|nr:hypothetical protein KIKIMORA_00720 [Brevundimonas phage vB_BpoS-Kikimora]
MKLFVVHRWAQIAPLQKALGADFEVVSVGHTLAARRDLTGAFINAPSAEQLESEVYMAALDAYADVIRMRLTPGSPFIWL